METVKDKIERWKILADILLNKDKKSFIKEINEDLHFCEIISMNEDSIIIKNFGPEQRANTEEEIYWVQILEFDEYKVVQK